MSVAARGNQGYRYLDYAASAPLCREAVDAMTPYLVAGDEDACAGSNPNSLHTPGREAFATLEGYRKTIASCVNAARPDEIVFTSGATESDNAIIGIAKAAFAKRVQAMRGSFVPKVVTSAIEHDAVTHAAESLTAWGFDIAVVKPTSEGFVTREALAAVLDETTVLVSIQTANAEIGAIQPISELAQLAHATGALFHTDATQAIGKIAFDVRALGVDAASWTSHKIGGPKGIGALYLKARTPFEMMVFGGGQESGRRSGTQNLMGAAGFAAAMAAACEARESEESRSMALRDRLYAGIEVIEGVRPTIPVQAGDTRYLATIANLLTPGNPSERMVLQLDERGFGVSGGSACASHSLEPSHVLTALGIKRDLALCELRVSWERYTETADIDAFLEALAACLTDVAG